MQFPLQNHVFIIMETLIISMNPVLNPVKIPVCCDWNSLVNLVGISSVLYGNLIALLNPVEISVCCTEA